MNKLQTLKCIELTSQAQADHGTVCYHDPIANCDYLSYENGYIRRAYTKTHKTSYGMIYKNRSIYQLNPTKLTPRFSSWDGSRYYEKERLMVMDPEQRMEILSRAVVNYRQYLKKQKKAPLYN
jgi:hypothetical protein